MNPEPIDLLHETDFRLGDLQVRPAVRGLAGPGGTETLEPRVMQVLVALARAGGEVVSRDGLIASCWEGRIVGEDAIQRCIARLLEAYAEEIGIAFNGFGSWTLKNPARARALEPDEC